MDVHHRQADRIGETSWARAAWIEVMHTVHNTFLQHVGVSGDDHGDVVEGAFGLAGDIPEIAGAVAEAGASFIEVLFEIIASIFDS